jgi:hypothetical protein
VDSPSYDRAYVKDGLCDTVGDSVIGNLGSCHTAFEPKIEGIGQIDPIKFLYFAKMINDYNFIQ